MVDNNQAGNTQNTEKAAVGQPRSEQPRNDQQRNDQNRGRNYQGYNQGQRQHNQARQQNQQNPDAANREAQGQNQPQNSNQGHFQPSRNNAHQARQHDQRGKDNGQPRGYYRDREKLRDAERDAQPRQHTGISQSRYGNQRNRAEETIDDIKQDIIRLEKEIDLEIKEIRSMKL